MSQANTEGAASNSRSKRKKSSWIWQHFKEEEIEKDGAKISIIKCQEKIDDEPCDKSYKNTGSSTGNAIHHLLSIHNISKDGTQKINEVGKVNKVGFNILFEII